MMIVSGPKTRLPFRTPHNMISVAMLKNDLPYPVFKNERKFYPKQTHKFDFNLRSFFLRCH